MRSIESMSECSALEFQGNLVAPRNYLHYNSQHRFRQAFIWQNILNFVENFSAYRCIKQLLCQLEAKPCGLPLIRNPATASVRLPKKNCAEHSAPGAIHWSLQVINCPCQVGVAGEISAVARTSKSCSDNRRTLCRIPFPCLALPFLPDDSTPPPEWAT